MSKEELIERNRELLKSLTWDEMLSFGDPDQAKGIPPPPAQKSYQKDALLIELIDPMDITLGSVSLKDAINRRRSRRKYNEEPLSIEELSFLLWAVQGVHQVDLLNPTRAARRTVPSGGARNPYETYLIITKVEGLEPGVYRYIFLEHKLQFLSNASPSLNDRIIEACDEQSFTGKAAVVFVWAAIPCRTEWRYSVVAYKDILIEAGHICQNLYLACEALGAGTCAISGYDQKKMDSLLGIDGQDEFTVYTATVGKVSTK